MNSKREKREKQPSRSHKKAGRGKEEESTIEAKSEIQRVSDPMGAHVHVHVGGRGMKEFIPLSAS